MPLIKGLCKPQGVFSRKPKTRIRLTLQTGEIKQLRGKLSCWLRFFGDSSFFISARSYNTFSSCLTPEAIFSGIGIGQIFFKLRIKPPPFINACRRNKLPADLPVIFRNKFTDLFFALDDDRKGRCLHAPHGC